MSNMSYCRFENTLGDLNECLNALEERDISSDNERRKANRMLITVCKFLKSEGIIENYDQVEIDRIIIECGDTDEN